MSCHAPAVLWTPQSDAQALTVAASRVTCIMLSVLLLGLLSVLIYPQAASEQVGPMNAFRKCLWCRCDRTHHALFHVHPTHMMKEPMAGTPLQCLKFVKGGTPRSCCRRSIFLGTNVLRRVLRKTVQSSAACAGDIKALCVQVLGSLHRAMESTALLNRIVWEEVISKCREESFRISQSFRLANDAASMVLRGNEEPPGRAQSSPLTCAGSKHQSGPASPAVAASQGPGAAPMCIEDKGLEGGHAADGLCTPQCGAIQLPVGPASHLSCAARGLDMPQPGTALSWDKVAEVMPPSPQGIGPRTALRGCTSGHTPVRSVFASKLSRPGASAATPCRCDLVLCSQT